MDIIQPIYATLDQSKSLKEKGFKEPCGYKWSLTEYQENSNDILIEGTVYSLFCHRDFGMYAIQIKNWNDELVHVDNKWSPLDAYSAPEQWMIIEWLRITHNIHVQYLLHHTGKYAPFIVELDQQINEWFDSPQEAYSAAIDYVLKELI